eukprot:g65231.t1
MICNAQYLLRLSCLFKEPSTFLLALVTDKLDKQDDDECPMCHLPVTDQRLRLTDKPNTSRHLTSKKRRRSHAAKGKHASSKRKKGASQHRRQQHATAQDMA